MDDAWSWWTASLVKSMDKSAHSCRKSDGEGDLYGRIDGEGDLDGRRLISMKGAACKINGKSSPFIQNKRLALGYPGSQQARYRIPNAPSQWKTLLVNSLAKSVRSYRTSIVDEVSLLCCCCCCIWIIDRSQLSGRYEITMMFTRH